MCKEVSIQYINHVFAALGVLQGKKGEEEGGRGLAYRLMHHGGEIHHSFTPLIQRGLAVAHSTI